MTLRHSLTLVTVSVTLVIAACGGAAQPGQPTAPPAAPTPAGQVQPPAGGVVDACRLLTADEVSAALGVTIVSTGDSFEASDAEIGYCDYRSAERLEFSLTYSPNAQPFVFETWKNDEGAEPVAGVGDEAVFASSVLFIKKGNALVTMGGESLEVLRQLGALAASRT